MNIVNILLMPFVMFYRGIMFILKLPYTILVKIFGKEEPKKVNKKEKKVIPEIKPGEEIKVIKETRSAYSTPNKPKPETDPVKIKENKDKNALKRQKEFEKLVEKAKKEEEKRVKEQEKKRLEIEKKEKELAEKERIEKEKEEKKEELRRQKEESLRKKGVPVSFSEKLARLKEKITVSKKGMMELEAKRTVLDEQFKDKDNAQRFQKPLLFEYIARNPNGILEKSTIEALSRVDVHSFLKAEGYEVYDITAASGTGTIQLGNFKFKISKLTFYLSQLSAYLKSGIALADAVKILDNQAKNINEKKAWRAVYYDLSMGDNLSSAMEKRKNTFPKLLINMIKTAEMTGNLTDTLDDMVNYYSETEATKKQMKSAMTYPLIVSIFAVIVVVFILTYIVPQFVDIYDQMGGEVPAITKAIIALSEFMKKYILYIAGALALIIIITIYLYKHVKPVRKSLQEFAMHVPVFGNIIIYNELTVFTKTFANLMNHNVFITDSIDVLSKITENEIYKKLIKDTAKNLTKGEGVSKAFQNHWAFPEVAYQMLLTGEKTGRLGPMMEKVSEYYQEQHRNLINQMKSLIEPVLIISLALVVGFILVATIIPMFGMYEQMMA